MRALHSRHLALAVLAVLTGAALASGQGFAQDSGGDLELGARLYAENCEVCHGPQGQGRVGATLSDDWPSIRPDVEIRQTTANGIAGSVMPAWSQEQGGPMSEAEIDAIVAYVLGWQTGEVVTLPTSTPRPLITPVAEVTGDPNQGAVLYDPNCALCHGSEGQGRIGASLAKDWPSIRPDLGVRQAIAAGIDGSVMPAWSQERGGPLDDEQIDDLVAFILTWSTQPGQQEPPTAAPSPTPVPEELPLGLNTGLVVGAVILVLIVIGGVAWASSRN